MADVTETDVRYIKGIGEKRAQTFRKLGVNTVGDLLHTYPRRYEDWKHVLPLREVPTDERHRRRKHCNAYLF